MIKTFELVSPYIKNPVHAVLRYDTEKKEFGLFVPTEVDASELPLIFDLYVQKGFRYLDHEKVMKWVKDRIVPPERQNIGMILRDVGIEEYDEFAILEHCAGKSCMDDFYMVECAPQLFQNLETEDATIEI